ncbi:phage tail tube protein [Sphingobium sp. YBL2]|uniref:phage tail tube protein n=1 Tax=Sphingobium sp. (strain YBL2) TaxID=484429 RepID=UPI0005CBC407|nr:phage tail tube protein [Sphingobium sp. YBL2]AJR24560.1 hypothetical protein TZ53_13340 [Sphingobium sp. YBL2]
MGYGQGINAVCSGVFESTYGVSPASGFKKLPFVSSTLGEERPLIEDDQLGFGREGLDPSYDVATNDGDIVVPVDQAAIGFWLRAMFGAPVTTGTGPYTHVFESGAASLPSMSLEIGNPDVPSFSTHYGAVANQMRIAMARSGMLNATIGLMCQGETAEDDASAAGTPTALTGTRYAQATGSIKRGGVALGAVVSAELAISNGLDKIEVIREDGRIDGVVPGVLAATLTLRTRFNSLQLFNDATNQTPIALEVGWVAGANSLKFALPRVFLPRPKKPIEGPRGIMADFTAQASGAGGHKVTATLINTTATY